MNLQEAKIYFLHECKSLYNNDELQELFYRIYEPVTSLSKYEIATNTVLEVDAVFLQNIITELKTHKPIQYILGYEWFGNFKLKVNEHTLIPRPETEELLLWINNSVTNKNESLRILDIGTGTGCIPIYLKTLFTNATIIATDIDKNALAIAFQNADCYNTNIEFIEDNILNSQLYFENKLDIIVSNPPYILEEEKTAMQKCVVDFEPHKALFVTNNDALQFYKAIVLFAKTNLKKDGFLFFETHQQYATQVLQLCIEHGFDTELKKDIHGNDRMIKATFKDE